MGEKLVYDGNIFARSFSRYDQKKLRYGAFLGCLLVAFSFFTVFRPYLGPLPVLYTRLSIVVESDISTNQTIINENVISSKSPSEPICHVKERTEFCEMNGDVRVDGKSSTVFMSGATIRAGTSVTNSSRIIRPYPRRDDPPAMRYVTEWSIKSGVDAYDAPQCDQTHSVPAIIFSFAGYTGNIFHDFAEVMAPLYLTCRQFDGEVKFLVTNRKQGLIDKYGRVFQKLSRYESIDIDKEVKVHCFKSVTVGLKRYPKELKLNPSESPYSMSDFRQFLRSAYSLRKENSIKLRDDHNGGEIERPRILILSRKRTRTFTNIDAIAGLARRLGYEVIVSEADSDVERVAEMVNSCDVLMAVHGAGLTNMLFLPDNAVLIQVLGIGGMEWAAKTDYEEPSKDMKLRYLEYKIKREESSLMQQYPADHEVLNTPDALTKLGWHTFYSIYMNKQNVTLDINRFEPTLLKALELLHQ